ncbi:MAG: type I glyceraldehyde-3-phosphate dehydrogenase [Deltaproteobacteria bacterium]|nr:MAG: type I glyceraldehyde-3-phosphate dehydrogenase [Deltaproteobacteria bacterium]
MTTRLAINGLGRIGRLVFRSALTRPDVDIVAVNDLTTPETLAHLLTWDSVHGRIDAEVTAGDGVLLVNGTAIPVSAERNPEKLPWKTCQVDVAAECTGAFRDRDGAAKHLTAGAGKVIISAPAKDPDTTLVMGVNDKDYDPAIHHIISNASCTTNCLAPVAKVLHETFGIRHGLMTTIHSYTNDQRILDLPHKDLRRARSAALSMIPTTTGAAKAVALVLPELKGKLNGLSVRVPTPNVSLVDLVVTIDKTGVTAADVNAALKAAAEGELNGILGYCDTPLVSTDFNGSRLSSIVDALTTDVNGDMVKVFSWYDNECGYANRMVDLAAFIGKTR